MTSNVIIQVCGTNGSGKSHAVRAILAAGKTTKVWHPDITKGPIGYDVVLPGLRVFRVVGSYEPEAGTTGGADWYHHEWKNALEHVRIQDELHKKSVLFEGSFVMNHTYNLPFVAARADRYHILALTTPVKTCLEQIDSRRAVVGKEGLARRRNIDTNFIRSNNYANKMRAVGAKVHRVSRNEVYAKIVALLGG